MSTCPVYVAAVARQCGRDWAVELVRQLMQPAPPDPAASGEGPQAQMGCVWVVESQEVWTLLPAVAGSLLHLATPFVLDCRSHGPRSTQFVVQSLTCELLLAQCDVPLPGDVFAVGMSVRPMQTPAWCRMAYPRAMM